MGKMIEKTWVGIAFVTLGAACFYLWTENRRLESDAASLRDEVKSGAVAVNVLAQRVVRCEAAVRSVDNLLNAPRNVFTDTDVLWLIRRDFPDSAHECLKPIVAVSPSR